jgi:hypothetical protein
VGHLKGKWDGLGFKVGVIIKDVLALGLFVPGDDFLGLGHCFVK